MYSLILVEKLIKFQAITRKAKELKILDKKDNEKNNPEAYYTVIQIILLALLPTNKFQDGFLYIKTEVNKNFRNCRKWKKFMKYFKRQWVQKVTPEVFSVFGVVDRTNNFLESYHRTLNKRLGKAPEQKKLLGKNES